MSIEIPPAPVRIRFDRSRFTLIVSDIATRANEATATAAGVSMTKADIFAHRTAATSCWRSASASCRGACLPQPASPRHAWS